MDIGDLEIGLIVVGVVLALAALVPLYRHLKSKWCDYWTWLS
ncbi:MAG: hypothetical protein ACR2PO_05230 [Methyloligellaceae bacterium]